ncbi:MAG: prephenate dehydrogenase [Omnitrophica bacterium]|nr:prephenate dehydrogenase [Candidatus Omnitrophota bacterium]
MFKKITIIGVGLIGGSIGLAVQKKRLAKEVVGVCRRESSRQKAVECKSVNEATLDLEIGIKDADLIIIAAPVGEIVDIARAVITHAKNGSILIDVGSTKETIVKDIEKIIPSNIKFVGTHPMAGSEKSGVEFANDKLFHNSVCVITDTKKTNPEALAVVTKFWNSLGATCEKMPPDKHDHYISFVSHLPHVAAVALTISANPDSLKYAATGFRDTTRIASANPNLWKDIFESNKQALLESIDEYKKALEGIERSIKNSDSTFLVQLLKKAKEIRDRLDR